MPSRPRVIGSGTADASLIRGKIAARQGGPGSVATAGPTATQFRAFRASWQIHDQIVPTFASEPRSRGAIGRGMVSSDIVLRSCARWRLRKKVGR